MVFNKRANPDLMDTLIGEGSQFTGKVEATSLVRIDGTLKGDVHSKGNIIVGEKGVVEGNIFGLFVTIAGKVIGDVKSAESLILMPSSNVNGNLHVAKIVIEEGAQFEGNCKMEQGNKKAVKPDKAS